MNRRTETQNEPPQTYRAAVEYVTDYLLHHPPTYELEFRDPAQPNYLLDSLMLLREWLHESWKATHRMTTNGSGEGWTL